MLPPVAEIVLARWDERIQQSKRKKERKPNCVQLLFSTKNTGFIWTHICIITIWWLPQVRNNVVASPLLCVRNPPQLQGLPWATTNTRGRSEANIYNAKTKTKKKQRYLRSCKQRIAQGCTCIRAADWWIALEHKQNRGQKDNRRPVGRHLRWRNALQLPSRQLHSLYQCCCTATPCSFLYLPLSRARVSCSVPFRLLVRCTVDFLLELWFQTLSGCSEATVNSN